MHAGRWWGLVLLGVVAVAAAEVPADGARLGGRIWRLMASDAGEGWPIPELSIPDRRPVEIVFGDDHIQVSNLCNRSAVDYRFDGDVLIARGVESSAMGCSDAREIQERAFHRLLHASPILVWKGGEPYPIFQLRIVGERVKTLTFQGFPTRETLYGSAGEAILLEVAPRRMRCVAWEPEPLCLKVRRRNDGGSGGLAAVDAPDDGPEWRPFQHPIDGHVHEEGARELVYLTAFRRVDPTTGLPDTVYFATGTSVRRETSGMPAALDQAWPAW